VKRWIARLRSVPTEGRWLDAALTALAVLFGVGSLFTAAESNDELLRDTDALAIALGLAVTLPMYWRRTHPMPALLVSVGAITILGSVGYRTNTLPIAVLFLTYAAAAYQPLRRAVAALAAVVAGIVIIYVAEPLDFDVGEMFFNVALFSAAWLGGLAMRSRSAAAAARLAEADERAESHRQQAARAVAEERLRIAQELHDVVAHSMSVIAVQAGMGVHVIDDRPDQAKEALQAISRTSRATLAEMRQLLGVLRGEDGDRESVPAPCLADVDALVGRVRSAGVPVELDLDLPPDDVPLGVELSAYRVVQEGLTNVLKHAGQASAVVRLRYDTGLLSIEVSDDGRGAAASHPDGGHGLAGMRERVEVWGGTLDAGPSPGGGFHVLATLPYGERS
jgi:signal transduction histidine kinase